MPLTAHYRIKATQKPRYLSLRTDIIHILPVSVVNNTEYNNTVPSIKGINVIRLCKQSNPTTDIPAERQTAFYSMYETILPVKT